MTSAQMSKNLRKQEMVALLDRVPQMYQTLMGMIEAAVNPGPMSMIAAKLAIAYQGLIDQFMTEFEVPKKDELNPELIQEVQIAQQVQQQLQQAQQMAQQAQQQAQQMGQQLQQAQGQLAAIQGQGGMQGPGMGPQPGPPPGVQGPPGMGGPPA